MTVEDLVAEMLTYVAAGLIIVIGLAVLIFIIDLIIRRRRSE